MSKTVGKGLKMEKDLMKKLAKRTREIADEQNLLEYGDNLNYGIGLDHMEQAIDELGIERGSYNSILTLGQVRALAEEM
ncbi:MAG: hypothetical protein WAV73_04660 [Candidatus Moraniibacteriota bacterium]